MNVNVTKLRFAGDNQYFEFEAKRHRLEKDINQAFVNYRKSTEKQSGALHVFHQVHGWNLLTIQGVYLIVSNPLRLDYDFVDYAISDTMIQLNLRPWPVDRATEPDKKKIRKASSSPCLKLVT